MFGLTKREQRWKAEQEAFATLAELFGVIAVATLGAVASVRIAEVQEENSAGKLPLTAPPKDGE